MATIISTGESLAELQQRLLEERQWFRDTKIARMELYDRAVARENENHLALMAFLDARIAAIDALIGVERETETE